MPQFDGKDVTKVHGLLVSVTEVMKLFAVGDEDGLARRGGCSASSRCLNAGTCDEHTRACHCAPGYRGHRCQQVLVTSSRTGYDVTDDPCASLRCLHGGLCAVHRDDDGRPTAACRCSDDWTGKRCQVRH